MAIFKSNNLVAAAHDVQRRAITSLEQPPHLAVVRFYDPEQPNRYRPTGSYAAQIRNHAGAIGIESSVQVVYPGSKESVLETIQRIVGSGKYTGVMPLYPLASDRSEEKDTHAAVKEILAQRPGMDIDDLLAERRRAPTPSAMFAMSNLMLHPPRHADDPEYFEGRRLEELRVLRLPKGVTADNLIIGGRGELTMGPGLPMLEDQGIFVDDTQIITHTSQQRWDTLPDRAVILTATPTAGQIRNENIRPGTVIADAGFGIIDGRLYGNADPEVEHRPDVLWTPPQQGIGPVSTTFLLQELLYEAGLTPRDIEPLTAVALGETVDYAAR